MFGIMAMLSAARAQPAGTANAIVVKIPGANLPSSVILSIAGGSGAPGQSLTLPVTLSLGAGTTSPASFQMDLSFDPTKLTFVSASPGGVLTGAGQGLSASVESSSDVRLSTTGTNQNGIASGVVATAIFRMAASFGAAGITAVNCMSADALSNPLSTGCMAGTIVLFTCDVTGDGKVGVADVAMLIGESLGLVAAVHDMNRDGVVNVADTQKVVSAALGRGCVY
jgi:hypothetical protein